MAKKYRRGELVFYKGFLPKEFKEYIKQNPDSKEYVDMFLDTYIYNYKTNKWNKRDDKKCF